MKFTLDNVVCRRMELLNSEKRWLWTGRLIVPIYSAIGYIMLRCIWLENGQEAPMDFVLVLVIFSVAMTLFLFGIIQESRRQSFDDRIWDFADDNYPSLLLAATKMPGNTTDNFMQLWECAECHIPGDCPNCGADREAASGGEVERG